MTVCIKDITNLLDNHAIDYNPNRLYLLLEKLDHEDLEDLFNMMQDLCDAGYESSCREDKSYQEGYDEGYNIGYNDGYDNALDDN